MISTYGIFERRWYPRPFMTISRHVWSLLRPLKQSCDVQLMISLQRQNLLLAMAAPCARASSFPQITSESTPLEPT